MVSVLRNLLLADFPAHEQVIGAADEILPKILVPVLSCSGA
jgi:hypothetical protein